MPPVTNGQFSFNVDTFYVAASGGQIHRRAAPPEIKALYDTSVDSTPDHPGHWYEAQLIHYGLPPSKVKATAKMRLLKALQDGSLSVPKESIQIEKNLKKEWKKKESEEKLVTPGANRQTNTKTTTTKSVTTKTTTSSKTVESKTTATKAAAKPVAAKASAVKAATPKAATIKAAAAKATAASKTATKAAAEKTPAVPKAAAKTAATKAIAAKGATAKPPIATKAAPKAAAKSATAKTAAPKKATATKTSIPKATAAETATPQTAAAKRKRASNDEETPNQPQTAKRRVGGKKAQDNTAAAVQSHPQPSGWAEQPEYEDAPPSYDFACGIGGGIPYNAAQDQMDIEYEEDEDYDNEFETYEAPQSPPRNLKRTLGLLNGTYEVYSFDIEDQWPDSIPSGGLTMSLRLHGNQMWGSYDFGAFEGVIFMPQRPMRPSFEVIPFEWRGRETGEGQIDYGEDRQGWIQFLGDGDIVGQINCLGDLKFRGQRISGNETNSVRTGADLQEEWDQLEEEAEGDGYW